MNWVIKSDVDNYLHHWERDLYGDQVGVWTEAQGLAHRFCERNIAARIARQFQSANARVVHDLDGMAFVLSSWL